MTAARNQKLKMCLKQFHTSSNSDSNETFKNMFFLPFEQYFPETTYIPWYYEGMTGNFKSIGMLSLCTQLFIACITEQTHVCVMVSDLLSRDVKLKTREKSDTIIYAMHTVSLRQVVVILSVSFLSLRKV